MTARGLPMTWYYDVISPFAYLALPAIEALAQRRSVTWCPIVFGGVLKHWGQLGPAEIAPKRLHTYRLCQFIADRDGVPFRFPPLHPFRSLEAMRLLAALDSRPDAVRTVFDFIWAEGRDASDPVELDALCGRLGVEPSAIANLDAKARLRQGTEDAIAAGVFGVPTLAVGRELFWGVDALPMAEAYAHDATVFDCGEMARLEALPNGVAPRSRVS